MQTVLYGHLAQDQLNEQLTSLYKDFIDGGDLNEIARRLDISKFSVYQYFNGKGKSISTATDILTEANNILEERKKQIERAESLSDYLTD